MAMSIIPRAIWRVTPSAERTFLAIRTEAEGQPEFRLGLGEIYARLGKTTESDAEFAAILAKNDPKLSLHVASVYRDIGSIARAKQIASQVFESAASPVKEHAASLLGIITEGTKAKQRAGSTRPINRIHSCGPLCSSLRARGLIAKARPSNARRSSRRPRKPTSRCGRRSTRTG
jgi:hypothetical protein